MGKWGYKVILLVLYRFHPSINWCMGPPCKGTPAMPTQPPFEIGPFFDGLYKNGSLTTCLSLNFGEEGPCLNTFFEGDEALPFLKCNKIHR